MSTSESDASEAVLIALRRIMRAIDMHSRQLSNKVKLTIPQLVALKELAKTGDMTIGTLARRISLSNATVTGIVDRLEARGLIERHRTREDRRRVLVCLSEIGEKTIENLPPLLQERFIQTFTGLQDREQEQILASLQKIAIMMDAEQLEASPVLTSMPIDEESPNPAGREAHEGRTGPEKAIRQEE
jgi:DNA-binding MarR family transcriptional regulator